MCKYLSFFLYFLLLNEASCETGADVDNLLTQLFTTAGYNRKIRPLIDQTGIVFVEIDFYLNSVIEFDEQEEVLKTSGYLFLSWTDEYLRWTPADYNNTQLLFVPQEDIWKPDISLRNTYKTFTGLGSSYLNAYIYYDGGVRWLPFQILESTCAVDITYFPFDTQTCDIKFTAWSYDKTLVEINAGRNGVTLDDYSPNAQWELTGTAYREVNTEEAAVIFTIELSRKPSFYVINIILPVILLSILNVFTFLLPVASGEKAGYSVTVFLSLAVFLTIIASELPKNSDVVSLMSVYLTLMSCLSTFIVLVCLIQIRLASRNVTETPINKRFRFLINLSLILRCKRRSKINVQPTEKEHIDIKEQKCLDNENNYDWTDVVNAIDFLFFWLSLLFTFLCTTIIFAICST